MTSPLFPFETERHRDETIPSSAHPIHFTGPTDPALDPDNEVAAGKMWRQSDNEDTPTWFQEFVRNELNTAWIACGPPWVIADYTEGQVPVADEFGRLAPGDVSGGESGPIDGSGVTNTLAKWQDSNTVVESSVTENATDLTSTKPLYLPAATTSVPSVRLPHGSVPSSPTNGDVWTTTAGIFVRINGVTVGPLSTGGGGGWTEVVSETGTSFANWTGVSGTWSSNGTEIIQTDTSGTEHHARLTAVQPTAMCVWEADVTVVTGAGADSRVGLLTGYNASLTGITVVVLRGDTVSGTVVEAIRQGTGVLGSETFASTYGTFYNLKLVIAGTRTSVFVNGTHYVSVHNTGDPANTRYIGLYSYQASVKFKNIKLNRLTLPGE